MSRFLPDVAPDVGRGHVPDLRAAQRVLPYMWPRDDRGLRIRVALSGAVLLTTATLNAVVPVLFAMAVDALADPDASALMVLPIALLVAYGGLNLLAKALNELRWILFGPIEQRVRRRLGLDVFRHLHSLSLRFHLGRRTGALSRVLENGMRAVADLLFDLVFVVLPLLAEIVLICAIVFATFDPGLALILVVTLALYLVALVVGGEHLRRYQRPAVIKAADAHGKAVDSLLNYETVKYFGNERYVAERYDVELGEVERLTVRSLVLRSLIGAGQITIVGLGMTAIVVIGGTAVARGRMSVGELVLINTYLLQLFRPLERLGHLYRSIKQDLIDLEQMLVLFDETNEVSDAPGARPLPDGPGEVAFETVSFAYDPRRPVLSDISLRVAPGRTLALVGPSGGGKTTIGRLLFRFYNPTRGRVLVDGHDIAGVTQDSLRAAIAVVPQDTVLFNESIYANIAFGRPDATREDVEWAARLARIHDFIVHLPDGWRTVVGERGLKLSGGEKQRVAIARAVLKRPRMYIFDEATSALDSHTERAIQDSLHAVSAGTTTLIIAHRLSTVVHADEILFIDGGRIVERGDHNALLAAGGLYAALWQRQLEGHDLDSDDEADERPPLPAAAAQAGP